MKETRSKRIQPLLTWFSKVQVEVHNWLCTASLAPLNKAHVRDDKFGFFMVPRVRQFKPLFEALTLLEFKTK